MRIVGGRIGDARGGRRRRGGCFGGDGGGVDTMMEEWKFWLAGLRRSLGL